MSDFPKYLLRSDWNLARGKGVDEVRQRHLQDIPGVWVRHAYQLSVPSNAAPIVEHYLSHWGCEVVARSKPRVREPKLMDAEAFQAQWNPGALQRYRNYQRKAVGALFREGSACGIKGITGSGKTWVLLRLALTRLGPLIEVTKRGASAQHARDFTLLQQARVYLHKPASERRIKDPWHSIQEYLDWCRYEAPEIPGGGPGWRQRPIIVMRWDALRLEIRDLETALETMPPTTVIYDEIQEAKSHKRKERVETQVTNSRGDVYQEVHYRDRDSRTAAAGRLSLVAGRRIGATATWIKRAFSDWWGPLSCLDPLGWGSYRDFTRRYGMGFEGEYAWVPDHPSIPLEDRPYTGEFNIRKNRMIYQIPDEEVMKELPPREMQLVPVPVEAQGSPKAVKAMIKQAAKMGKSHLREALLLEASARLLPWTLENSESWIQTGGLRKGKVAIFAGRHRDIEELRDRLTHAHRELKNRPAVPVDWYHGGRTDKSVEDVQAAFMSAPGPYIVILSVQACGTGMDWHDADYQVNIKAPTTPGDAIQLAGRTWRMGMKSPRPVVCLWPYAQGTVAEPHLMLLMTRMDEVTATVKDQVALELQQTFEGDPEAAIDSFLSKISSGSTWAPLPQGRST